MSIKNKISPVIIGGKEVLPIVEGGKGVAISTGKSCGLFAQNNAVGTFSGVNADLIDDNGEFVPMEYKTKTRLERHNELVEYGIKGAISQAKRAFDLSCGKGRIHMNVLWEMGGASKVLHGVLERARGLIDGITCGAGMPYKLSEIAEKYKVHYYPIVSSMRAFRALWKRSYSKCSEFLGAVVYECPWKAGGHNGLSNAEDPLKPETPYRKVAEIREFMNEIGLKHIPIIIAGGIWNIKDYEDYLNNPEIGSVAFQFGTRPMFTQEYEIPQTWKKKFFELKEGDIYLNRFSPTGFYSSAVRNSFLEELCGISDRQVDISDVQTNDLNCEYIYNSRGRKVFVRQNDFDKISSWKSAGFDEMMKTPDGTAVFVSVKQKESILQDQRDCMGCLSGCRFSNWSEHEEGHSTGKLPDPRSFCIQKSLQSAVHAGDMDNNLMFSGYNGFRFAKDDWYQGGAFMPTISQLIERISEGY